MPATSLEALVQAERVALQNFQAAQQARAAALSALDEPIKQLFHAYEAAFEPLLHRAGQLGLPLAEVCVEGFHEGNHSWGNRGLAQLVYREDGFVQLLTADYFRNERSTMCAYMPAKYLCDQGAQLLQADAQRVEAQIDALEAQRQAQAAEARRKREIQELARLQKKYPGGVS